jgi:hypothetical protein
MSGEESFSFSCPGCPANIRVPLRLAGKNATCLPCKASITLVPSTAATPVACTQGSSGNQSPTAKPQTFCIRDPFTKQIHGPYESSALKTMAAKGKSMLPGNSQKARTAHGWHKFLIQSMSIRLRRVGGH